MNSALHQELIDLYRLSIELYLNTTGNKPTLKFYQALVPGDNCLLWRDLCNTFHLVNLESKEFYQGIRIQINGNDFYPNHICEQWKAHVVSSRTGSYWFKSENKGQKNKTGRLAVHEDIVFHLDAGS